LFNLNYFETMKQFVVTIILFASFLSAKAQEVVPYKIFSSDGGVVSF